MNSRLLASTCLLLWSIPACVAEAPDAERVGSMKLPIVSTSAIGRQYRLTGTLEITGPEPSSVSAGGDAPSVSVELRVGDYNLALAPGWQLERIDTGMPTPVQATLATATPVPFSIQEDAVTPITLAFQLQGDSVVFGTGTLDVSVEVEDEAFESSCTDGMDNDADMLVDCNDPECAASSDCASAVEQCSNMVDDDANGLADCDDPACSADPACAVPECGDDVADAGEYCFSPALNVPAPIGGQIMFLKAADFNGDGVLDIVAAGSPASVVVLLSSGGSFVPGPIFNAGGTVSGLAIADLDLDTRPDVVIANVGSSIVRGHSVSPTGQFSNMPGFTANVPQPREIVLGDFNADMRTDLIVGTDSQLVAFRNTGTFVQASTVPVPGPMGNMVGADFDADGRLEVATSRTNGPEVRLFESDTTGILTPGALVPVSGASVSVLAVADANADTAPDIVFGSNVGSAGTLLNMMGTFASPAPFMLPPITRLVTADLNFDGRADLLGGGSTNRYVTALNNGMGTFNLGEDIPGGTFTPVLAADVNGDTFADIVVGRNGGVEIRASNP